MTTVETGLSSLPSACSAFTTPCVACYLGAATTFVEPPFNITQTIDVTFMPIVTELPNGQNITSFQRITDTALEAIDTGSGQQTIFGEDEAITWSFNDLALTFPTTYAYFDKFSGAAASTAADECANVSSLTRITVPTSYLYAPTSGTDARKELTLGVLPTSLLGYLGTLEDVTSRLSGNAPLTCSPTTVPATTYTCTSVVPSTSCFSTFTDSTGSTTSSCSTGTGSQTSTLTVTLTGNPAESSAEPTPINKVSAATLRRITGKVQFIPYTPPVDAAPVPTPSPAQPQIIGPNDPSPPAVTQPVQPDPPAQNQPPSGDDNSTPPTGDPPASPEDNPPQQDSPTTDNSPQQDSPTTDNSPQQDSPTPDNQPAGPEDGTSTPNGTAPPPEQAQDTPAPSPQSPSEDDPSSPGDDVPPQEDGDSTPAPDTEEPPQGQEDIDDTGEDSGDLPPQEDGDSNPAPDTEEPPQGQEDINDTGEDSDDLPPDDSDPSDAVSPLTESPLDSNVTDSPDSAANPDAGTTGPGDYIASGLGASGSRTLTVVGPSGTSVTVEPYTGSAVRKTLPFYLALLGVVVGCAALL